MRRLSHRSVLSLSLATALVGAVAPVVSAAETVHLFFRTQAGPIRILGVAEGRPHESMSLNVMAAGLPATGRHRLVASKRPCSQPHLANAAVFVVRLGPAGDDDVVRRLDQTTPLLITSTGTRSVRLFTRHSGGTQVACAKVIPMVISEEQDGRELVLGVLSGTITGIAAFLVGSDSATLSVVLTGLPAGSTSRVVAVDEACGESVTSADVVGRATLEANAEGIVESIDFPSYFSLGRENSIECLLVTKGGTGLVPRATAPGFVFHTITWD